MYRSNWILNAELFRILSNDQKAFEKTNTKNSRQRERDISSYSFRCISPCYVRWSIYSSIVKPIICIFLRWLSDSHCSRMYRRKIKEKYIFDMIWCCDEMKMIKKRQLMIFVLIKPWIFFFDLIIIFSIVEFLE